MMPLNASWVERFMDMMMFRNNDPWMWALAATTWVLLGLVFLIDAARLWEAFRG